MKRNVILEGSLGQKYGREWNIEARTLSDVFRCLECNFDDFRQYLIDCDNDGIGFACDIHTDRVEYPEELLMTMGSGDITISPVPAGSKSGGSKILVAAAILTVLFLPGLGMGLAGSGATQIGTGSIFAQFGAAGGMAGFATTAAAGIAVNLALAGFQQILAPDPSTDAGQDESYVFQGAEQTIIEGAPVPVVYGKLRVPGRPIAFDVRNKMAGDSFITDKNGDYEGIQDMENFTPKQDFN